MSELTGNAGGGVSFNQAMESLTAMFDSIDREVIFAFLKENNGALEPTIDALLAAQGASENPNAAAAPPQSDVPVHHVPAAAAALSDDFLGGGGGGGNGPMTQMELDEQYALALQQQLLMQEQREMSRGGRGAGGRRGGSRSSSGAARGAARGGPARKNEAQAYEDKDNALEQGFSVFKQKMAQFGQATKRGFNKVVDKIQGKDSDIDAAKRRESIEDEVVIDNGENQGLLRRNHDDDDDDGLDDRRRIAGVAASDTKKTR